MEWYRLKLMGLKNSRIRVLMNRYNRYKDVLENIKELSEILNFTPKEIKIIVNSNNCSKYLEFMTLLDKKGIGIIDLNDYRYPKHLKNIYLPPLFLFYKGNISLLKQEKLISIVGTRKATKYGITVCKNITKELVAGDVVIVSGLAQGIDTIAHKTTVDLNGKTIAVLGCGIDIDYPKENIKLKKYIENGGLLISEFPIGVTPLPKNFPIRNRIIAGLSKGTVVVESSLKSGSLITANLAFDEGRDVFAVPGDIGYHNSKGCNELIKKSQAKLITNGLDILNEYGWEISLQDDKKNSGLKDMKLKIYEIISIKIHLEDIKKAVKCDTSELLSYLMELEIEGYIQSLAGGYYRRVD